MGWAELAAAFAAFFISHSVPLRPPVKARLVAHLGRRGFTVVYSALSIAVLTWLLVAAGRAPFVPLWYWAPWQNHLALAVMLAVCLIVALSLGRANPFSFGGPDAGFSPARPGIVRWMRHPLLVAMGLWAGVHTLANGDLAHVLVFGSFTAFAALGGRIIDRRKRRQMGPRWQALLDEVRQSPVFPPGRLRDPAQNRDRRALALRLAIGVAVYLSLLALHPVVIGVEILS